MANGWPGGSDDTQFMKSSLGFMATWRPPVERSVFSKAGKQAESSFSEGEDYLQMMRWSFSKILKAYAAIHLMGPATGPRQHPRLPQICHTPLGLLNHLAQVAELCSE